MEPNPYLERRRLEAATLAILADDAARAALGQAHEAPASSIDPS
jgi:hypothetical protein